MKVTIMQPTYMPWIGYFSLMEAVDIFIIFDSVQFSKRSWQQRNSIKSELGSKWLTVPVITKGKRDQLIKDVKIDYSNRFPESHINLIKQNYKKSKFFNQYSEEIFNIFEKKHENLSKLSIELILLFRKFLGIKTEIKYSSHFFTKGIKDELLAELCGHVGAKEYISPPGSKVYLENSTSFTNRGISIKYYNYKHIEYPQLYGHFLEYMSIIDLLFNYGSQSKLRTIVKQELII